MNRPLPMSPVLVGLAIGFAGCAGDGIDFFEVVRSRVDECAIRSNGEFCVEPEQFDPPTVEVWAVETRAEVALLYVDEEVWVLDPLPGDADPATVERTATKTSVVIDGLTGCRTDAVREVGFLSVVTRSAFGTTGTLDGSLSVRSVLTGPESCGSTPVGERTVDVVSGTVSGP